MAGIKQIVAPPETFRFPRWKSNINYAKDSVVASNSYGLDSDATSFYIAQAFIPSGQNRPNLNATWIEIAADAAAINAIVRTQLDQDSDMIVMRAVNRRLDSETDRQRQVDSDFQKEADSEAHWWRAKDSDIKRNFARALDSEMHGRKAADSDLNVRVDDADSDIARLRVWVDTLLNENDSDNNVLEIDHDSDVAMIYHDFKAADSDDRVNADRALDSETHDRKAADSDIDVRLNDHDSDLARLRGWVDTLLVENDSDNLVQNVDHDSDIKMVYHDYRADDSDIRVVVQRLKDQVDSDNIVSQPDHDSDIKMVYHDYRAEDSDFLVKYDSELGRTYHDFSAADSEVIAYLTEPTTLDYGTYF